MTNHMDIWRAAKLLVDQHGSGAPLPFAADVTWPSYKGWDHVSSR